MEKAGMGQAGISGPYAVQIGKLADSLEHLSKVFLKLERQKQVFTKDELQEMFFQVEESVCTKCDHMERCWGEDYVHTYQLGYEVLHAIEEYGKELNLETKRKLQKKCVMAPKFQSALIEVFHEAKQNMLWSNRLVKNREGCAVQMDLFAQIIKSTAKEFEDSILIDVRMEKKIRKRLDTDIRFILFSQHCAALFLKYKFPAIRSGNDLNHLLRLHSHILYCLCIQVNLMLSSLRTKKSHIRRQFSGSGDARWKGCICSFRWDGIGQEGVSGECDGRRTFGRTSDFRFSWGTGDPDD